MVEKIWSQQAVASSSALLLGEDTTKRKLEAVKAQKRDLLSQNGSIVFGAIFFLVVGIVVILVNYFTDIFSPVFLGVCSGLPFLFSVTMASLWLSNRQKVKFIEEEKEELSKKLEKEEQAGKPEDTPEEKYFDKLVIINVSNLELYYGMVKNHANNSFGVSIIAGVLGFLLIGIGLVAGFTNSAQNQLVTYISAGSGVITEFIAGVFFILYSKTVTQLKEYHDSLLDVQNILLAFKLISDKDYKIEPEKLDKILDYLFQRHESHMIFSENAESKK